MIIQVDEDSAVPPYAQVQGQIATMVRSGVLRPGDRLPAIRHLANDLGLAVNTVARAYQELERQGLVRSRGRHGTTVSEPVAAPNDKDDPSLAGAAASYALQAAHRGIDVEVAIGAIRAAFQAIEDRRGLA